jgi:hypothetical protein
MRIKSIVLVSMLVTLIIALPQARAMKNLQAPLAAPDLVVMQVSPSDDFESVKVRVKNQGNATAAPCYMAITIKLDDGKVKVYSPKVPGLAAGQEAEVVAKTEFSLSDANFEAKVDRSNTVKESDETNNTRKGKFGHYKP